MFQHTLLETGSIFRENDVNHIEKMGEQAKSEWVAPQVRKMDAGSAESQAGSRADGGGGAQGS